MGAVDTECDVCNECVVCCHTQLVRLCIPRTFLCVHSEIVDVADIYIYGNMDKAQCINAIPMQCEGLVW